MKIRCSARAVLLDEMNRVLLIKFLFNEIRGRKILWVTPGGGLEEEESYKDCVIREVFEETGIKLKRIGPWIWTREVVFKGEEDSFISYERYFLVCVNNSNISLSGLSKKEQQSFYDIKWWSIRELMDSDEHFGPPDIGKLVFNIVNGEIPKKPIRIS